MVVRIALRRRLEMKIEMLYPDLSPINLLSPNAVIRVHALTPILQSSCLPCCLHGQHFACKRLKRDERRTAEFELVGIPYRNQFNSAVYQYLLLHVSSLVSQDMLPVKMYVARTGAIGIAHDR